MIAKRQIAQVESFGRWYFRRARLRWLVLVAALLFLNGCGGFQSVLNPGGPQSEHISRLWWFMLFVSTAVFLLVMISLWLAVNSRTKPTNSSPEKETVGTKGRKGLIVILATGVTVAILFAFMVDSFLVGRGLTAELERKQGLNIEITGHQWWWEVRYQDVDASSIFTTANEIHIPVGVPVTFSLKASDVIHSFWVPNLHGKKDLIPGKISTIWLQADRPGVYRGQCAEYCGHQHAHMALWIFAEPLEQFDAWRRAQIQSAVSPASASEQKGQQVFLSSACVMCHAINGTPAGANFGPNLTHLATRKTIAAATLANDRSHLQQWVDDSQQVKPGNRMPANKLRPEDMQALLDYLQSLK
ncbi:MAG TPA: cytochrome c oxidase subunit II [Pyrinomonadaceae bacterium]|jgi:cytochrome c oxidase subunit 2|nr:cytochrome c oxidase subunit II [Pyrinomonadaceae bacterium]